jgi:hypothetical protein
MEIIDALIRDCVSRISLSSGDNLTGFLIDCEYALEEDDLFKIVRLETTDHPESLLNGVVEAPSVTTIQEISQRLSGAWSRFAYPEFQAVSVRRYTEAVVMRFITAVASSSLGVTGTIVARSANYSRLVDDFNRDYSQLGGALKSLPGGLPPWAAG